MSRLSIAPISLREARAFVRRVHRHHTSPPGGKFAVAVVDQEGEVRAVGIAARPVSRHLDDGWTIEVSRVASDGARNACSMVYGALWRAARAMGYRRAVTYTLPQEGGASLRGAGWRVVHQTKAEGWHRSERPRVDEHPTQHKFRWETP